MTKLIGLVVLGASLISAAEKVTFTETIAPILYQNCVTCHRPGEAAPFSLISYDDARKRGALIAAVTKSRYMPPWHAAHGFGEFEGERRLSDAQIAAIGDWVGQGMPQGDVSRMPKLPQFEEGWHLGKPDLILEMPVGFNLPATGSDVFRNFVIPTGLTEDKWVRAVEFRPSARKVVHHVLFAYAPGGSMKRVDGADGKPGFGGMGTVGVSPNQGGSGGLGGWAVGATPVVLPAGLAHPLPKGSDFLLQMHFHLTGKPETEKSVVGIYFADKAPEHKMMSLGLPALFGFGAGIDIPAGEKNYTIQDSFTLPVDAYAYSAVAHAHYVGKEMKMTATLPDGSMKPLIWIADWDFNWQDPYIYKDAVTLPKGTRIDATLKYDNSTDNPRNPSNPPKRVWWGEESFDEMGTVGMTLVAAHQEDEAALQQALNDRTVAAIRKGAQDGTAQRYLEHQRASGAPVAPPPPPQRITLFDREGKTVAILGQTGSYNQAALSPDGTRVAAIQNDPQKKTANVVVFDVSTGTAIPITADASPHASPVWSPDASRIAWVSGSSVYQKPSDGSGNEELLYKHDAPLILTDWSAGGLLCFWSGDFTYTLSTGANQKAVQLFRGRGGRFSPDGKFLAYSSNQSGRFETYLRPVADAGASALQVSKDGAAGGISWRQDGKEFYYLGLPDQVMMAMDMGTRTSRPLFRPSSGISAPAQLSSVASRDGQRFVFVTQMAASTAAR